MVLARANTPSLIRRASRAALSEPIFGPPELEPPFPKFPWLDLPPDRLLVVKMYQVTNYLQGVEGDLNSAHPNYLHRDFEVDDNASWAGAGWQSIADLMSDGSPEIECQETPYLMHNPSRVGIPRDVSTAIPDPPWYDRSCRRRGLWAHRPSGLLVVFAEVCCDVIVEITLKPNLFLAIWEADV